MSICAKIGCAPLTLSAWVNKAVVGSGKGAGVSSEMTERLTTLERGSTELRQANEILRKGEPVTAPLAQAHIGSSPLAKAYFAMTELDHRST